MELVKKIEMRKTESLIPYARNSRTHSKEQVAQIAASIKEFGFNAPVAIDAEGGIIAGHGRVMAAQLLGLEEVPVVVLEHLTEAQKKAYIIADNKLALNASWDNELLKIELEDLKDLNYDLSLTGFDNKELDAFFENGEFKPSELSGGVELDTEDYSEDKFQHKCPRCGMLFNDDNNGD